MGFMLAPIGALFGGGAAAGGAAAASAAAAGISATLPMAGATLGTTAATIGSFAFPAAPAAAAASTGLFSAGTLSTILQGGATVLGLVSSIAAGAADRDQAEMMAADAEAEQSLETLKGIERRRSLKLATLEAIGEMDAAYAASGVDLSFGTAAQARQDALREADLGFTAESGTTMTRLARLTERAASYRAMGKRAMRAGVISGLAGALSSGASIVGRY